MTNRKAKALGTVVSVGLIAGAASAVYFGYWSSSQVSISDDAILNADVVHIAPSTAGRISRIAVNDSALVRKGDVLFEIDGTTYALTVDQTRADLDIALAAQADQSQNIQAQLLNVAIAEDQVERAETNLELATQTLNRLSPMEEKGYVSAQQVDTARTAQKDARVSLNEALKQLEAAQALVRTEAGAESLVAARRAALAIAEHELSNTVLRAPHNGRIAGLTISSGEHVLPGQRVFTLIRTDTWFASAAYLETSLPDISVGNCATVYALSDRKREIRGVVEGIGWGVASKELIELPISLPIVPKSLDWVRIQQRFPVRIRLIDPPAELMRVGASANTVIHHDTSC
ncbi:multidrug transporter subunit MdtN [Stappia stellulata]|uniref:multidrug transporter subunit MdtN n=1 Tax=Stappia stellulata TaxID=71235 RepID=UPI0003F84794|nr:multidrug transporter subunit MdtN [Stappia stellulata]